MRKAFVAGLACLVFCVTQVRAETPSSPLRLIPDQADFLMEIQQPRQLVEVALNNNYYQKLQEFAPVKELMQGTQLRRFRQLIAYLEKEMGASWPKLLDQLAGGGIALGVKFDSGPDPALIVIQGKNEKQMEKFVRLALNIIEQEIKRQEGKTKVVRTTHEGVQVAQIGKDLRLAVLGSTLVLSNRKEALKVAYDLHKGDKKNSLAKHQSVQEAAKLLPKNSFGRLWLNMRTIQKLPQARELYKTPRDNAGLTVLFGAFLDILGQTPYITAGLYPEKKDGLLLTFRAPRGRKDMGEARPLFLPEPGKVTSRPLLAPKEVLYSQSFYLDLSKIWTDRKTLFKENQVRGLERFNKNSGRFLTGAKLSELLTWSAPYHRLVVVNQKKRGYKKAPGQEIPAFAFVTELREPEKFYRRIDTILRGAGFLATTQFRLKLIEEKHKGCDLVGYRFSEKRPLKQDRNNIRFNFSPCYTRVGKQLVLCSTMELCRELVDLLKKEQSSDVAKEMSIRTRTRFYAGGVGALLKRLEDQLVTQTILNQAVPPGEARTQVKAFLALLQKLGTLTLDDRFLEKETQFNIRYQPGY